MVAPLTALLVSSAPPGATPQAALVVPPPTPTWAPLPAQVEPPPSTRPSEDPDVPVVRVMLGDRLRTVRLSGDGLWWAGPDGRRHAVEAEPRIVADRGALRLGTQRLPSGTSFGGLDGSVRFGGRAYVGTIQLLARGNGIMAVNHVDLEHYVAGVVAAETVGSWGAEVKRAQAVAARSYTLASLSRGRDRPYDLTVSSLVQLYKGKKVDAATRRAVESTRGVVLESRGRIVSAYYTSSCGGHTEPARGLAGGTAGVTGVADPWCARAPGGAWHVDLDPATLGESLAGRGLAGGGPVTSLAVSRHTAGGQAAEVTAAVGGEAVQVKAKDLRFLVGPARIRSTRFSIRSHGPGFRIEGTGFGHGSGLCQWGAHAQAEARRDWRRILSFYFPDARLRALY